MIEKGRYANFEILSGGDLKITLNKDGKKEFKLLYKESKESMNDYDMLREIVDDFFGNGWTWLAPEQVGALTDAPILSNDAFYNDDGIMEVKGDVWWYPNYAVIDLAKELIDSGELIFTKAEEWED
jgi:hypothetical protein